MEIKASKEQSRFKLRYEVKASIRADREKIWSILTSADQYDIWNSTIISLEGEIAEGQKIRLKSTLDAKRTFTLKVSEMNHGHGMTWQSGAAPMFRGARKFSLHTLPDDTIEFVMSETLNGIMLPLIAGSLPDFRPAFEQFAKDLKKEAEK